MLVNGMVLIKEFGNLFGNVCILIYLVMIVKKLVKEFKLGVEVLECK